MPSPGLFSFCCPLIVFFRFMSPKLSSHIGLLSLVSHERERRALLAFRDSLSPTMDAASAQAWIVEFGAVAVRPLFLLFFCPLRSPRTGFSGSPRLLEKTVPLIVNWGSCLLRFAPRSSGMRRAIGRLLRPMWWETLPGLSPSLRLEYHWRRGTPQSLPLSAAVAAARRV
jgi:hypothetical protein